MKKNLTLTSIITALLLALCLLTTPQPAHAQVRGQYTPGINATNSGTLPEAGFTYSNIFQLYSFSKLKGPNGETLPVNGNLSLFVDHNVFLYVAKKKVLGGKFAMMADLPIANSSLTSANFGTLGGGGGFADSYYQPLTLGWDVKKKADVYVAYGFVAPTGRFNGGASNNIGSGYWGHDISSGQTVYLSKNRFTQLSAYQQYEIHTTQRDTNVHPGQTFNLDYSLTHMVPLQKNMHSLLQFGLVGYEQIQTTDKSGPGINPTIASQTHYKVNALGGAGNIILPVRKTSLGIKLLKEFSNKSTVEGYSLQISGAITF